MFLKNSFISIGSKLFGALLSLILGILLARILGPESLGQYQIFITAQTLLLTIFSFGLGNSSLYFIKRKLENFKEIISMLIKIVVPSAILLSFLFGAFILNYENYFGKVNIKYLIFFLIGTFSLFTAHLLKPLLYVENRIKKIMFLNLIPLIFVITGGLVWLNYKNLNINSMLFLWGLGNTIVMFLLIKHFLSQIDLNIVIKKEKVKKIFNYGIKLSATNLLFVLNSSIIVLFIKYLLEDGFKYVGIYSRAVAISSVLMMIPNSIGPLLFSKWASLNEHKLNKQVEQTQRVLMFFSIIVFLLIFLFGNIIIEFLYGDEYLKAVNPLLILSFSLIFYTITEVLNNLFASCGLALITLKIFCISFIIILITSLILIPIYDIIGAAFSILLGSLFNAIALLYFARKKLDIKLRNSLIIKIQDIQFISSQIKPFF